MSNNRRNNKTRRGLAAVEVGLLLPVFMMLMMGIMDFGRMYWTQSVVRGAAYEGVRVAILSETTNAQVESKVLAELSIGGITDSPSVSVGTREPSNPVDVTVSVPFTFFAVDSLIPTLSGISTISATAVMTHER